MVMKPIEGSTEFAKHIQSIVRGIMENGVLATNITDTDMQVTEKGTPDMSVDIAAGKVLINGIIYTYAGGNEAISNGDATHDRRDLIIYDQSAGDVNVVEGTPSADANPPELADEDDIILAIVKVDQNESTNIVNGDITDMRTIVSDTWRHASDLSKIDGGDIYGLSVDSAQINADAVIASKIAANAVEEAKINAGAVTSGKIGNSAVTEGKINNGAVTVNKIGTGAVTLPKMVDAVKQKILSPYFGAIAASGVVHYGYSSAPIQFRGTVYIEKLQAIYYADADPTSGTLAFFVLDNSGNTILHISIDHSAVGGAGWNKETDSTPVAAYKEILTSEGIYCQVSNGWNVAISKVAIIVDYDLEN